MAVYTHFHLLIYHCFFLLAIHTLISTGQISDYRLCGDSECKYPISTGRTLIRYHSLYRPLILSFNGNVAVKIFSKSAGSIPTLWGGEINGKRGYFPLALVREDKILVKTLNFTVPTEEPSVVKPNVGDKSKNKDKISDSDNLVRETSREHSGLTGTNGAVENQVQNNANSGDVKSSKVSEEEKSPYSFVKSAWDSVKSNKLMTMSLDGIQSVAEFTNRFPESISKLTDHVLRGFSTNAQEVPKLTTVQSNSEEQTTQAPATPVKTTVEEKTVEDTSKYLTQIEKNDTSLTDEPLMSSISPVDSTQITATPSLNEMDHTIASGEKERLEDPQYKYENDSQETPVVTDHVDEMTQTANNVESKIDINVAEVSSNLSGNVSDIVREEEKRVGKVADSELSEQSQTTTQDRLSETNTAEDVTPQPITSKDKSSENETDTKLDSKVEIISKEDSKPKTVLKTGAQAVSEVETEAENVSNVGATVENVSKVEPEKEYSKETVTNDNVSRRETTGNTGTNNVQDVDDIGEEYGDGNENEESDIVEDDVEDDDDDDDDDDIEASDAIGSKSPDEDGNEVAYGEGMTQPYAPPEILPNTQDEDEIAKSKGEIDKSIDPTTTLPSNTETLLLMQNQLEPIDNVTLNTEAAELSENFTPEIDQEAIDSTDKVDSTPSIVSDTFSPLEEQEENKDSDKSDQFLEETRDEGKWTEYDTDDTLANVSWNLWAMRETVQSCVDELGTYMQWIIDLLPESVQASLHEQKEKMSPRVIVFTTITGTFLTCLLSVYFVVKTRSNEDKLVLKLCQLNKKQFDVIAERDILKEESLLANEKINTLETNLSNIHKSTKTTEEEVVRLKEKNMILEETEEDMKEELVVMKNCVTDLREDVTKITKQHADLKRKYDSEVQKCRELEHRVIELESDIDSKEKQETENEQQISTLEQEIIELKESNAQLLQEAQVWNERIIELQNQLDLAAQSNDHLTAKLNSRQNEVELLKETITHFEVLQQENDSDSISDKLRKLMDVSSVNAELKAMILTKQTITEELNSTKDKYKLLQECMDELSVNNEMLKQRDQLLTQERDEAVTKLQVLSDYFKEKEIDLQRKLGFQEAKRQQTEESAESINEKAALYEQEVMLHRTHVESLKKELENQARSFKSQIAQHENKSHDNWLAARAAERKSEEARQEASMLRNKLTLLEQEKEAMTRAQGDGLNTPPTRPFVGNNGELLNDAGDIDFTSPLDLSRRLPFLPLDRPLPPPSQLQMPPPPPFERLPIPHSVFEMHGPLGPPPMMPFDPRMPLPPPLAPHFGDGRLPSPPLDRRLTPPRDFRSGGPPGRRLSPPPSFGSSGRRASPPSSFGSSGRRPASPPSYMRRPPSGRRMSPPRMPGDRFHEPTEPGYHQPSPPRFLDRRTPPVKQFTETPPAKIASTGIPSSHDKNKPLQNDTSSV